MLGNLWLGVTNSMTLGRFGKDYLRLVAALSKGLGLDFDSKVVGAVRSLTAGFAGVNDLLPSFLVVADLAGVGISLW